MKRLDINLPQESAGEFERSLLNASGIVPEYEITGVSVRLRAGREASHINRYTFIFETAEEKAALVALAERAAKSRQQHFTVYTSTINVDKL